MLKNLAAKYVSLAHWLTKVSLVLSYVAVLVLTVAMLYEVVARYVFNSPTIWAFDIAYMSNAAIFLLGNAWVLQRKGHVAIRLLYDKMSKSLRTLIDAVVQLFCIFPLFLLLSYSAIEHTLNAYQTGEVEMVSPWGPLMWPFYVVFVVGLLVFSLQVPASFLEDHVLDKEEQN